MWMLLGGGWRLSNDVVFFFQAEDGIRDLVRSRGLGDVYKRQALDCHAGAGLPWYASAGLHPVIHFYCFDLKLLASCLLYTSDAADERSSVDLGGRRIIQKKIQIADRSRNALNLHRTDSQNHKHTRATQR